MGLIDWLKEIIFGKKEEKSIKPDTEERDAYAPMAHEAEEPKKRPIKKKKKK
ncbi:MAG: hypothetical protein QW035_02640 [Candidatus Anstonellales archaeon]